MDERFVGFRADIVVVGRVRRKLQLPLFKP
jgi:hypothetical protein